MDKEIKLIHNNFNRFEDCILRQRTFCSKYLINFSFWSSIDEIEQKSNNDFYRIRKKLSVEKKSFSKSDIDSSIQALGRIEDSLKKQRLDIKASKDTDDLVFAYDEILKRSIKRIRQLVAVLVRFI